jgi:hypothetical protein
LLAQFEFLRHAVRGQCYGNYQSGRSGTVAAIVERLILYGWPFELILKEFIEQAPGHFRERDDPEAYLRYTYCNGLADIANDVIRQEVARVYGARNLIQWRKGTGIYDRRAWRWLLAKAYQFNTWDPTLSVRELGMAVAGSKEGASAVFDRLERDYRLITTLKQGVYPEGTQYRLLLQAVNETGRKQQVTGSNIRLTYHFVHPDVEAEFRGRQGIGLVASEVLDELYRKGSTVDELAAEIGVDTRTIRHSLKGRDKGPGLEKLGLAVQNGNVWSPGPADPENVAVYLGCDEAATRRRQSHAAEKKRSAGAYDPALKRFRWVSKQTQSADQAAQVGRVTSLAHLGE